MACCPLMTTAGALIGSVEGCFLKPVPGSTMPMLFRALRVIASRSVLLGACTVTCVLQRGREGGAGNGLLALSVY